MSDNVIEIINNDYTFEIEYTTLIRELLEVNYTISADNVIIIDYAQASGKPSINSVTLLGNKTSADLGLANSSDLSLKEDLSNKINALTSSVNDAKYPSAKCVYDALQTKQDTLISGENIKTVNNISLLGSDNIELQSTIDDLSTIRTNAENACDKSLSNINSIGKTVIDGQFVASGVTIYSGSGLAVGTTAFTHSLSSYLPNDAYNYEIYGYVRINTASTANSTVITYISSDASLAITAALARTPGTKGGSDASSFVIPISASRNLYSAWEVSVAASSSVYLVLSGYRRMGTNS